MDETHEFWQLSLPWPIKFLKEISIPQFYPNLRHRPWGLSFKAMGSRKMLAGPARSSFLKAGREERERETERRRERERENEQHHLYPCLHGLELFQHPLSPQSLWSFEGSAFLLEHPADGESKERMKEKYFSSKLFKFKNTGTDQSVASVKNVPP